MDLGAYAKIEDLTPLMRKNGIEVPRLRGLRLMKDEKQTDMENFDHGIEIDCLENLCESIPPWTPYSNLKCYNHRNDKKFKRYTYYDGDSNQINWKRIHGKRKKILKTYIHNEKKRYERQYTTFNKYCGQDGVLYIHARIGGNNWNNYDGPEIAKQPWFIEKVDDAFDNTYCDIYARIK